MREANIFILMCVYKTIYTHMYVCKIITMSLRVLNTHTSGAGYNNNNIKASDYFSYSEFHAIMRSLDRCHMVVTTSLIYNTPG